MPGTSGLVGCCTVGGCAGGCIIGLSGPCWALAVIVPEARMNAQVVSTRRRFSMANLLVTRADPARIPLALQRRPLVSFSRRPGLHTSPADRNQSSGEVRYENYERQLVLRSPDAWNIVDGEARAVNPSTSRKSSPARASATRFATSVSESFQRRRQTGCFTSARSSRRSSRKAAAKADAPAGAHRALAAKFADL